MLQIKTITASNPDAFDELVNNAIAEGWEIVKRDVLPPYESQGQAYRRTFYAELEREVDELKEEEEGEELFAHWVTTRDPIKPFACSCCGYRPSIQNELPGICDRCKKMMFDTSGELVQ